MTDQVRVRLAELRREYETGQRRLQEVMAEEVAVRETMLRISGAIQVLEELAGEPAGDGAPGNGSAGVPEPGSDAESVAPPPPGTVLSVS